MNVLTSGLLVKGVTAFFARKARRIGTDPDGSMSPAVRTACHPGESPGAAPLPAGPPGHLAPDAPDRQ